MRKRQNVFSINNNEIYISMLKFVIIISMDLDGLTSKYQVKIPIKSPSDEITKKYQTKKYKLSFPSELLYKRDVYIIDCILMDFKQD